MYYRLNRKTSRIETNLLDWERSWKNVKILTYPTRFANELRLGPDPGGVDTVREYWTPTPEQNAELTLIEDLAGRTARSNELFLQWRQARLDENARRKALNNVAKTRIDLR